MRSKKQELALLETEKHATIRNGACTITSKRSLKLLGVMMEDKLTYQPRRLRLQEDFHSDFGTILHDV